MNNYYFVKGNIKYSLNIENIKYCIGWNYKEKYNLKQIINEYFLKPKESEYTSNNTGKAKILLNDKPLNEKNTIYYCINDNYSLLDEVKLTSKSLMTRYLEILMSDSEYNETINTLNVLLESLGIELDQEVIISRFISLTSKSLLKLLSPFYMKKDEQANEYDLDYNEKILIQLKMINYLSIHDTLNNYLCLLEIPVLTNEIQRYLETMKCIVIVITSQYEIKPKYEDICLFDRYIVDYTDDEFIYSIMQNKGIYTLEEAKDKMKTIIDNGIFKLEKSINL